MWARAVWQTMGLAMSLALVGVVACGDDSGDPTHDGDSVNNGAMNNGSVNNGGPVNNGNEGSLPPTEEGALNAWIDEGWYTAWEAESAPHPSTGPHFGIVRTFVNDALFASLSAGNEVHPVGSAVIKELYGQTEMVQGHSVMVKVDDAGPPGNDWFWFEVYQGRTVLIGRGEAACTGCHGDGSDFVLTPFPLQ